jgi:hypothetical protein
MVFYAYDSSEAALQLGDYRYYKNIVQTSVSKPDYTFDKDEDSSLSYELCSDASLMESSSSSSLPFPEKAARSSSSSLISTLGLRGFLSSDEKLNVLAKGASLLALVVAGVGVALVRQRRALSKKQGYAPLVDHS